MKDVLSNRVAHVGDEAEDRYRFRVAEFSPHPKGAEIIDLKTLSPEGELEMVANAIARADTKGKIHVQGVSLSGSIAEIRKFYESLGYFDAVRNRYDPDMVNAPVTFGADLSDTGFLGSAPRHGTGNAKAVRSALNIGLLCHLRLDGAAYLAAHRSKKIPKREEALTGLLVSGAVSPFTLGRLLSYNAADRGLADRSEEFLLTIGSRS
jgi:hypothetical protein